MVRALLVTVILGGCTAIPAADPPAIVGGNVSMMRAKVEGDNLVITGSDENPSKLLLVDRSGGEPKEKLVEAKEIRTTRGATPLKFIRVTDTDDKEIPQEQFKERFKEEGWVAWPEAALAPEWKAKFRKGTVFVELGIPTEGLKRKEAEKIAPQLSPKQGVTFFLEQGRMKGAAVEVVSVPVYYALTPVKETVVRDGKTVEVTTMVDKQQRGRPSPSQIQLKNATVTTADGKQLTGDELAKKLAEPVMMVRLPRRADPEWRKLFSDDVFFLELDYTK